MKDVDEKAVGHILEALVKMAADRLYDAFGLERPTKTGTCNQGSDNTLLDDKNSDDN